MSEFIAAEYIDYKTFKVTGDETNFFNAGRRLEGIQDSNIFVTVASSSYNASENKTTVVLTEASSDLVSDIEEIRLGIVQAGSIGSLPTHTHTTEDTGGVMAYYATASGLSALQTQVDDLDLTYTTDAELNTVSGILQNQIDNLDLNYATDAELTATSGVLQTQITQNASLITTTSGYLSTALSNHTSDTDNPHSVTEYQVLPTQSGNAGKSLVTDGSNVAWDFPSLDYDNSVVVAKDGSADYNTIQGAIDSITDATTNNRYCILVYPGTYAENITLKDYIIVLGVGGRMCTTVTATSGTLLTMPANEAHWKSISLYMTPTSSTDKLIDVTTGSGITGQFRIEDAHLTMLSSAAINPVMIDSNASYGSFLLDDIITYNIANASATGTMIPIRLQSGNDRTYILRTVITALTASATANIEVIQDNSTGRVLVQSGDFNIVCSNGAYSGNATFYAQYGGAATYAHSKQINGVTTTLTSNGNGTGYVVYLDSDTNNGQITVSRNTFVVSGFANNRRYYSGTGDEIFSYFNQHASELTDNKVGDIREADIYANDALIISEKIGLGTSEPTTQLHLQGSDPTISLDKSGASGNLWQLCSHDNESFRIYNDDTSVEALLIAPDGDITVNGTVTAATAPTTGNHLTNKTYVDGEITSASGSLASDLSTHANGTGADHTYIDQDITTSASPTFAGINITTTSGNIDMSSATDGRILLPVQSGDDPTNPTLAFGTGGKGFYTDSADGVVRFADGGVNIFQFSDGGIVFQEGNAPFIANEAASATNPTLCPTRTDLDTGIGHRNENELCLVAGGSEKIRATSTATYVRGDFSLTEDATNHLVLPLNNDSTTPTLAFGDGDTGFYESSDDTIQIDIAGTALFGVNINGISSYLEHGPGLRNTTADSTTPTVLASRSDTDTGIGRAGADQLSLIAGGSEKVNISTTTITPKVSLTMPDLNIDMSGGSATSKITFTQYNSPGNAGIVFGTGMGIFSSTSSRIDIAHGSARSARFESTGFYTGDGSSGKPFMSGSTPSATVPVFIPADDDTNTGIGHAAADQLSLIAGGSEIVNISTTAITANGSLGIGTTPDACAILHAQSTTKGFLPPVMTGVQAEAIASPAEGLMVFATASGAGDITAKGWWGWNGDEWLQLG